MLMQVIAAILLAVAPLAATPKTPEIPDYLPNHRLVKSEELKAWYDQKQPMTVIDARSEKYFDGKLLPNAIWLAVDTDQKKIEAVLQDKDGLIVVYCSGVQCPASGWLYDKLTKMGYTNLYEYHEGIKEWTTKGYAVVEKK
jgi:rhodanese-related sulfurtransferase